MPVRFSKNFDAQFVCMGTSRKEKKKISILCIVCICSFLREGGGGLKRND